MKQLEQYTLLALDVVEDLFISPNGEVNDEWDNAAVNFGAVLRQMGLLTAVTAFSQKKSGERKPLMRAIVRIMDLAEGKVSPVDTDLLQRVKENPHNPALKMKVNDATIALKLALRVYIRKKQKKHETTDQTGENDL